MALASQPEGPRGASAMSRYVEQPSSNTPRNDRRRERAMAFATRAGGAEVLRIAARIRVAHPARGAARTAALAQVASA